MINWKYKNDQFELLRVTFEDFNMSEQALWDILLARWQFE